MVMSELQPELNVSKKLSPLFLDNNPIKKTTRIITIINCMENKF